MPADKRNIPLDTAEHPPAVRERAKGLAHMLGADSVPSRRESIIFKRLTAAPA